MTVKKRKNNNNEEKEELPEPIEVYVQIIPNDLRFYLSGGKDNSLAEKSIGGPISHNFYNDQVSIAAIWDPNNVRAAADGRLNRDKELSNEERQKNDKHKAKTRYRCIYFKNMNKHGMTLFAARIRSIDVMHYDKRLDTLASDFGDYIIEVGLGTSAIGSNTVEPPIKDEFTAPKGVKFSDKSRDITTATGSNDNMLSKIELVDGGNLSNIKVKPLVIGDIPAGQHKAIWLRRRLRPEIPASIAEDISTVTINVDGDTQAKLVARVRPNC